MNQPSFLSDYLRCKNRIQFELKQDPRANVTVLQENLDDLREMVLEECAEFNLPVPPEVQQLQ